MSCHGGFYRTAGHKLSNQVISSILRSDINHLRTAYTLKSIKPGWFIVKWIDAIYKEVENMGSTSTEWKVNLHLVYK